MSHIPYSDIAQQYGAPVYIYDAHRIAAQFDRLKSAFTSVNNLKLHYAVKANSNLSILRLIHGLGAGLDTVSIEEVKLGLLAGVPAEQIIYTPNGVSIEELEEARSVCVRINPHVMAGGNSNISVGHIDSKFGISIHQVPHIKRIVDLTGMHINGIHMHTGSDILDIDVFLHAAEILFEAAKNFDNLEFIDFGSGFKVPYKKDDIETPIEEFGEKLSERFNSFCKSYGKELTLSFEPGKFLVSQSGKFVAKVNVVKQTTSTVFAGVDSGFNHLMRPMLYGAYHEIENLSNPGGKPRFYSVVGYICETDTFGSNRRISEINEGDLLVFHNSGAYCFSMASNYNSRFRPAEVLIHEGKDYLIRKEESFDDLTRNQVEINFE